MTVVSGEDVLVTGGAGFIGSHLTEYLAEDNRITVLDDFSTGSRANLRSLSADRIIDGSVTDADLVAEAVEGKSVVVHMAAMMGVKRTLERPLDVLNVNIDGTRNVLSASADADVDRVLVASTSEVYGDAPEPPYSEDDETAPKTNYAVAKVADERFTRAFQEERDLDYTVVRYFNVFGPRQDSSSYGYVVPIFVRAALADEPLQVHGDGEQTRDFTYIDDAVEGTVRALGPAGRNETFNIGGGSEVSIRELAEVVVEQVGSGEIEHVEHPRPYVVERRCADVTKARERLDYEPSHSIERGVRRLADAMASED